MFRNAYVPRDPYQNKSNLPAKNNILTSDVNSVEHGDVKVVAVNDPFIEPKYAVSCASIATVEAIADFVLALGIHAEV